MQLQFVITGQLREGHSSKEISTLQVWPRQATLCGPRRDVRVTFAMRDGGT